MSAKYIGSGRGDGGCGRVHVDVRYWGRRKELERERKRGRGGNGEEEIKILYHYIGNCTQSLTRVCVCEFESVCECVYSREENLNS